MANNTSCTYLFVENKKIYEKWASKTYPYKCDRIEQDRRFKFVDIGEGHIDVKKLENIDTLIFGWHGIPINKYYTSRHSFYAKKVAGLEESEHIKKIIKPVLDLPCKKYIVVQDMHDEDYLGGVEGLINYIKQTGINGIITPYLETDSIRKCQKHIPELDIIWLPHHIDSKFFRNWKKGDKKYDILLFGNDHAKFYPFRNRLIRLLSSKEDIFVIHKIDKPRNYFRYNAAVSDRKLSTKISESWLTLCTPSKLDYLLGKYFETAMSGSVVLGNMATDGEKIWEDNYIQLDPSMSDEEILETVSNALDNKKDLLSKAQLMENKISYYSLDNFTEHLVAKLIMKS